MIKLDNVSKIYKRNDKAFKALDGVSLELPSRGLIIITGHNGSGKTTLLNILANLDKPSLGVCDFSYGSAIQATIFQNSLLIDYLTVYENLELISKDDFKINELLEKYGLELLKNRYPNQISGGERQRVAIARALLEDTSLILCDEPTASLDDTNANDVIKALEEISMRKLVIVVTHEEFRFKDSNYMKIEMSKGKILSSNVISSKPEGACSNSKIAYQEGKIKSTIYKFYRRKTRLIFSTIISFTAFMLFLVMYLSLLLNYDSRALGKIYHTNELIDLSNKSLTYADIEDIGLEYDNKYIDTYMNLNDVGIYRVYYSDSSTRKVLKGKSAIADNEIIISDFVAEYLGKDYSEIINKEYGVNGLNLKVKGIFETRYTANSIKEPNEDYMYSFASIYMNEVTLKRHIRTQSPNGSYIRIEDKLIDFRFVESESSSDDAIYLSESLFTKYKLEEGKTLNVSFLDYKVSKDLICGRYDKELIIKRSNSFENFLSPSLANEIYSKIFYGSANLNHGISINNNVADISKALEKDFVLDDFNKKIFYSAREYIKPMEIMCLAIVLITLLIDIVSLIIVLDWLFKKNKSNLKVIESTGYSLKKYSWYQLIPILFMIIPAIALSSAFTMLAFSLGNKLMLKYKISGFKAFSMRFESIFYSLLIQLILAFVIFMLKKKKCIQN